MLDDNFATKNGFYCYWGKVDVVESDSANNWEDIPCDE